MADVLALPTVAAMSAAILLDAAAPALSIATPDPFAAYMASAQVAVPAAMPAMAMADPIGFPGDAVLTDDELPLIQVAGADDDLPQIEGQSPQPPIDPILSPALAMLIALVAPKTDTQAAPASRAIIPAVSVPVAHSRPLPQAGGEQGGARPNGLEPTQPTLPLAGGAGGGPVTEQAVAELIVRAASHPLPKQVAAELPILPESEIAVVAEVVLSAETKPTQAKARLFASTQTKDQIRVAADVPRPAERATAPARLTANLGRDVVQAEPIILPPATTAVDTARSEPLVEPSTTDLSVQRQLVIAEDGRWLDGLARDIAQSASGDTLRFKLEPVNLGSLTIAIAQASDGATIRMTAETHRARDLLVEAQPALVAEARANGLRISETHVDLGNGNRDSNPPTGGQPSFANTSTGQQAARQDGNARRQPDLPASNSTQPRSPAATASARDSEERFA